MRALILILGLIAIAVCIIVLTPKAQAQLNPGDILVIDADAGTDSRGALFSVDPVTGNRTVKSDFSNPSQGPEGGNPVGVAPGPSGDILVIDQEAGTDFRGALFSVNPVTGNRTVISDFGIPLQGSLGIAPVGVAVFPQLKPGDILVIDQDTGTGSRGALFSVNQFDGTRKVLSNFGIFPQGDNPDGLAVGAFGDTLVIDEDAGTGERGALFSVNSFTGIHTMISDFGDPAQGQLGLDPNGVALGPSGDILVIDHDAGTNFLGALFDINPANGNRVVISDFGNSLKGPLGGDLHGLALVVSCGGKLATRVGTVGADNITGTAGPDVINLLGGNDTANGGDGNDIICGGAGNDTMNGGNGRDRLLGQGGNDISNGDAGNDRLKGGGGNDNMNGGTGNDRCIGGPGSDTASSCETTTGVP